MTTPSRVFDNLPIRPGFPRAVCIVSNRRWNAEIRYPESWWWETEEGRCWLIRLVVATLYTFGLKRGVGAETISEFFGRLHLETHVGCSPSALRGVMHALEQAILETAAAWEHEGIAAGEMRPDHRGGG